MSTFTTAAALQVAVYRGYTTYTPQESTLETLPPESVLVVQVQSLTWHLEKWGGLINCM